MRLRSLFLIILFVCFLLFTQQLHAGLTSDIEYQLKMFELKNSNFEEITTDTINGVIIPQKDAVYYYPDSDIAKVEGYFTPTKQEILEAEKEFNEYLSQYKPKNEYNTLPPSKDLVKYIRQYVGAISGGKRKIALIFSCGSDKRFPVFGISGGGNCYFNILYDIKEGTFSNLWVNASM